LLASLAGALGGGVPASVELGVEGLLGRGVTSPLGRSLARLFPWLDGSSYAWTAVALVGIVAAVGVALWASETGARLTADTTAALRIGMMRAAIASAPRDVTALAASLGGPARPPGLAPLPGPKPTDDAVKLVVLRDGQGAAELVVAGLVTLPQAFFALALLGVDLARSGAFSVVIGGVAIFALSRVLGLSASRGVARATTALQATDAKVFSEVSEKLGHLEDLRLSGARAESLREVMHAANDAADARRRFARALGVSGQITGVLGALAPLLVLVVLTLSGRPPSAGEVAKLLLAIPVVVARLQAVDALRVGAMEKAPVLRNVVAVLGLPPRPDATRARVPAAELSSGAITFDDVSFAPVADQPPIVDGVSIDIPEGAIVGLCGPSGSGKSTLLRLLLRLDDPTEGAVKIGDVDVRDVLVDDLPRVFASLGQGSRLLPRTIAENVTLGGLHSDEAREDVARRALERAQIPELGDAEGLARRFVPAPPNLSGGEQRRVLLARALAQDAKVLVLDEPEAGLPGGQAEAVLRAAVSASKGRTLVVATHAPDLLPSTFNVLLEGGRVVARGTHAELCERDERYRELFSRKPAS
jgi:ATP-binding cassette subfamily B protein